MASLSFPFHKTRLRRSFGRIPQVISIPNLIEIQKDSYEQFLQENIKHENRTNYGIHAVFNSVFPINDYAGTATLEYVKYNFEEPKYDVEEAKQRGVTFSAPLKVTLRLVVWEIDEEADIREIKGIKEQDVYMGEVPLMTENGTFVINGTERVIVSQMHRSPGVFFDHDRGKTHSSGKFLYSVRVIPYRGSWLDIEFDVKDLIYFRIDRRRKILIGSLLRALGMDLSEILSTFYVKQNYEKIDGLWKINFDPAKFRGVKLSYDLINAETSEIIAKSGTKITPRLAKKYQKEGLKEILIPSEELAGYRLADDIFDPKSGEVFFKAGDEINAEILTVLDNHDVTKISILSSNLPNFSSSLINSIMADKNQTYEDALIDIYKVLRPGDPPTVESAEALFNGIFFDHERYDLSEVGRVKLNARLDRDLAESHTVLTKEDIIEILRTLIALKEGVGEIDDIDHLGNRRVRSVGELVENQFRIGVVRMERAALERMSAVEIDNVMPHDLVNPKLLVSVIREFFGTSQLSQFMDQTNPLSEITHKRRLSALGPGGLTRDRAGFEVRDVHTTHYGRICPIETPEGPNIGLINSMATFAKINKHGFIESPYRKVVNGKVTSDTIYLSAIQEGKYNIAQANASLDEDGNFLDSLVSCRFDGDYVMVKPENISFIDVSPMQVVSVAASLIPFLENDDANRALMGSNMQRQAVPLLKSDAPFVGTGIEAVVAKDSGSAIVAKRDGIVDQVDATRIVIRVSSEEFMKKGSIEESPGVDIYNLLKFMKSNHSTCINQKPLVNVGDVVKAGEVIADGPCTEKGELALGRNVLVAFMPWNGYNYEDSILISERIVKDDVFTSIHIEEFEVIARDTRLGPEEITRDIPNVGDDNLKHIDEVGIVHIGSKVRSGDILVGKVTPKSESPVTPEEKLLRAIFGEKAADVRDSSLRVPPGISGTIVGVKVFSRRGIEKDERAIAIEKSDIERLLKDKNDELAIVESYVYANLKSMIIGQKVKTGPKGFKSGLITEETLKEFSKGQWWQFAIEDADLMEKIEQLKTQLNKSSAELTAKFENKVKKLQSGDDLPQGALKVVKVFVAVKHKLQPGDKMAGRHGNKGVISRILPNEDMPHLEDGTPVDIILSPLGVPSRMNIGQVLETHLGWAAFGLGRKIESMLKEKNAEAERAQTIRTLISSIHTSKEDKQKIDSLSDKALLQYAKEDLAKGIHFSTPVFDGAKHEDILGMFKKADLDSSGQVSLIDGRTGEYFDRKVTVGCIYMMKLHHLVDDKMHARSVGPYSLVTQQPLGGKSHFGGQRLGEMECWALQAYGAAYTLQEMLTVKSDDVTGRIKIYESIVRGDHNFESGLPESFHVMIKELRSLCLNVELLSSK